MVLILCGSWFGMSQTNFFLPQNPVAAAYVLGRLSNQELAQAPRGEFVYVALLKRNGLDRKYRLEALEGLAKIRHTDRLTELLRAIGELDQKGDDARDPLRDLGLLLLQANRPELAAHRDSCQALAANAQLSLTRQIGSAACVTISGSIEPWWDKAKETPAKLADLIRAIEFIPDANLRAQFYPQLKPLLSTGAAAELRQAAMSAIVSIPGHDEESFRTLAGLLREGNEPGAAVSSIQRLPRQAWSGDELEPTAEGLVKYLENTPASQRTEDAFTQALQLANEIASLLPSQKQSSLLRILRNIGPTVVTLHAVYEQMRFDKDLIVVEAGKPVVIILQNDDAMPHNLAIVAPGTLKEIGLAAEKMPPDPDAEGRLYIPSSTNVLEAGRLIGPGQRGQLAFDAPASPGDYPFLCTFPGHWLRMSGVMTVVSDVEAYLATHGSSRAPQFTEWKIEDFAAELRQAAAASNASAGQELFAKLACIQCHKIASTGYAFGPDLTDVFKRYNNDRGAVLLQILEPSKVIADPYRSFNFDLKNGDSVQGLVLKEDDQTVTIQTGPADSLIKTLKKTDIQQRRAQTSSLMPLGLLGSLSKPQVFDLLAFLQSGGQPSPHNHPH